MTLKEIFLRRYLKIIILKKDKISISSTSGILDHKSYYEMLINNNAAHIVPHYLLMRNGEVVEFESKMEDTSIYLEDCGPLIKKRKGVYVDFLGTIYKDTSDIVKIPWKGHEYWVRYSKEQISKLNELIKDKDFVLNRDTSSISLSPNPTLTKENNGLQ